MHTHMGEESHVLLKGQKVLYALGDKLFVMEGPYIVNIPPMVPHSFQNLDDEVAELVVIFPTNVWEYDVLDYFPFATPEAKALAEEARRGQGAAPMNGEEAWVGIAGVCPTVVRQTKGGPDLSRSGKAVLGGATAVQLVASVALFFADLDLTMLVLVLVLQAVLVLVYLWDVGRNELVPEGTERLWRLAILFAGPLVEPVYFWCFILGGIA